MTQQKFIEIDVSPGMKQIERAIQTTVSGDSAKASQAAIANIRNLIVPSKGIGRLAQNTPRVSGKLAGSTIGREMIPIVGFAKSIIYTLTVKQDAKTPQEYGSRFYGQDVREGTKPHEIRARLKKVLRFEVAGTGVFAASVKHPGTRPNKYHIRTIQEVSSQLQAIYRRMGANITKKFSGAR